jgi:hypothetical protein
MSITIHDPDQRRPATYYIQVREDLERRGVTHAEMQPGAENVIWVSKGPSHRPVSLYYVFSKGRIVDVQVD